MTSSRTFILSLLVLCATACLCLLPPCLPSHIAYAEEVHGVDEILGVSRETFVANMDAHANRYLGTPYTYFADRMDGPGLHMDCSAFVGFALVEQGGVSDALWRSYAISGEASVGYPGTESIDKVFRSKGIASRTFSSTDEILSSGFATKGDIIFAWPQEFGDSPVNGPYSHVGFFWGDSPSDNKMWHSTHSDGLSGNVISDIRGKVEGTLYYRIYKITPNGSIVLTKTSSDATFTENNQAYSLAGAVFGVFGSDGREVKRFTTDEQGHAKAEGLAFGTYTVRELQAPPGYTLDETDHTVTVSERDATLEIADIPAKLNVAIQKMDRETLTAHPLGGASLAKARYRVTYPWQGKTEVREVETDANGQANLDGIPLGTVQIQEMTPPKGYLLDTTVHTYLVMGDTSGTAVYSLQTKNDVSDQAIRGDLQLLKMTARSHERLAKVPFKITSTTTQESHVLVTDANGFASTASAWNSHLQSTNTGMTDKDGIWFGSTNPDDAKGALPFDTYTIEEQPCEANAGKILIPAFTITVSRDSSVIDLGTLTDEGLPVVTIRKVNADTGAQLPGANLELQRFEDSEWVTTTSFISENEAYEEQLLPGAYRLVETQAPEGFLRADPIEFTAITDIPNMEVRMEDEQTHLQLSKISMGSGAELPGAHMQLLDGQGSIVEAWTSTDVPHAITGLKPGDYVLSEDAAPAGYDIATDIPFTLDATSKVQTCVMVDKEIPASAQKLPTTLDMLHTFVPALPAVMGAATAVAVPARRKMRRYRIKQKMLARIAR